MPQRRSRSRTGSSTPTGASGRARMPASSAGSPTPGSSTPKSDPARATRSRRSTCPSTSTPPGSAADGPDRQLPPGGRRPRPRPLDPLLDEQTRRAFDLLRSSSEARRAFRIEDEPEATPRARYGATPFGQGVLLARRLVEAGVAPGPGQLVSGGRRAPREPLLGQPHRRGQPAQGRSSSPPTDRAFSALLEDLAERRGTLDEDPGRLHVRVRPDPAVRGQQAAGATGARSSPIALAGGGDQGGPGRSARRTRSAAQPREKAASGPEDLSATIFHCLGHRPESEYLDRLGRPTPSAAAKSSAPSSESHPRKTGGSTAIPASRAINSSTVRRVSIPFKAPGARAPMGGPAAGDLRPFGRDLALRPESTSASSTRPRAPGASPTRRPTSTRSTRRRSPSAPAPVFQTSLNHARGTPPTSAVSATPAPRRRRPGPEGRRSRALRPGFGASRIRGPSRAGRRTRTNELGAAVSLTATTPGDGSYPFDDLRPSAGAGYVDHGDGRPRHTRGHAGRHP